MVIWEAEKDLTATLDEGTSGDCDLSSSNFLAVADCGRARVLLTNDSCLYSDIPDWNGA